MGNIEVGNCHRSVNQKLDIVKKDIWIIQETIMLALDEGYKKVIEEYDEIGIEMIEREYDIDVAIYSDDDTGYSFTIKFENIKKFTTNQTLGDPALDEEGGLSMTDVDRRDNPQTKSELGIRE